MTPNLSWNASQMRDWLDDKLATDLNTVTDLLSQTAFTLSELEEKDPAAYARLARGDDIQQAQRAYLMAEALRETLRYYQDQLKEASGVIAEYGRLIQEEADSLFDSDRVRYSACIEESAAEIAEIRQIIADSAGEWEGQISLLSAFLKYGPSSQGEEQQDWDWINNVLSGGGEPVTDSAPVTRVSASNSRSNRLSAAAGVAANDVDANITVLSENEVAIELKTGTKEKPDPVKGVQVKVRDAQGKDAKLNSYTTNDNGVAVIPVNLFSMDAYEILPLYVEVDPRPQGYRDFIIEDMDLAKGESYKLFLTPVNGQSSNGETANAANDVYPYMMTFNGRDIMNSEYDMIYSTANDYEFEIKVAFRNTDGKNLPGLVMRYYGTEDRVPGARDIYVEPTNHFDTVILNNVTYLYWVAAAQKQKDSDPTVWRIWGMAFDPNTNTVLDPSVLAEFKLPGMHYKYAQAEAELNAAVSNAILLGSGTGYLNAVATNLDKIAEKDRPKVAPIALFSFEEKLKPAANLITAIPRALAVKAGDFEDVTLGIMNEGNVPIAAFDIGMYEVVDGKEGDKPVETVHINGIDSTKNKITMADGKVSRTGKEVAYREEDYGNISRKHDWVLDSETKAYKLHKNPDSVTLKSSDVIKASKPEHIKVQTLMPGAVGNYCAAFKIPENWHGDKTLRLKVTAVSVESNVMAAVANASGLAANGEGESATLNYALNPKTGKLELQMPAQPNGAVANAIASGLYANEIDVMDTDVVLDVHDIELKHRIYEGPEGERMLDITVRNYAATRESLKLSCAVYADGASEPEYLNLPLYEKSTSNRRAQTITIPVSALVDDPSKHTYARVAVSVVGVDENAYANNEFDVVFGGENPLRFTSQPEDVVVQEGEDVSFEVKVGGGSQPYTYQWQVWDPVHEKWVDLKGFTEPTLRRKDIEKKWDGCVFRCVITDAAGTQIISETVTLTVRDKVDTGDHSDLPLYSIVAMIAIILLIALRRRREIG